MQSPRGTGSACALEGVIQDAGGSKRRLWDQRREFKVFFRTKLLSTEEEEWKKYGGRAF